MIDQQPAVMTVQLVAVDTDDPSDLEMETQRLRRELQDAGAESVDPIRDGDLPEGAKAGDAVSLGALAVSVLPQMIPKLFFTLRDWLLRRENRSMKISATIGDKSITVDFNPSTMTQEQLQETIDTVTKILRTGG